MRGSAEVTKGERTVTDRGAVGAVIEAANWWYLHITTAAPLLYYPALITNTHPTIALDDWFGQR